MVVVDLIAKRKNIRPGYELTPHGIVLHWTATPRATARNIRDYMNRIPKEQVSAHYGIDKDEVIQMVPVDEVAWHLSSTKKTKVAKKRFSPDPNYHLIGIELCHEDWSGEFADSTIHQAMELCGLLCWRFDLDPINDIFRHTDITGKGTDLSPAKYPCPRVFVEQPEKWDTFLIQVKERLISGTGS